MDLLHSAVDWIISWADSSYALVALFVLTFFESSFFPIPTDPLLIAMAVGSPENALFFATICTVASVSGAALGYGIGKWGGQPIVDRIFSQKKIKTAENLYKKYDVWAVGAAALTPIPYKVFTITAGIAEINFLRFILVSVIARGGRFFALAGAIFIFGPAIQTAIDEYFEVLTVGFLALIVVGFIAVKYIGEYLAKREEKRGVGSRESRVEE
ncbi:MAG: DedA family protein [Actinomycetota bacterium]|nr:DedA family protein [Rubrobacter sp.]MDQ3509037.1 DedA family protein [Actinomycetota bacterium]